MIEKKTPNYKLNFIFFVSSDELVEKQKLESLFL